MTDPAGRLEFDDLYSIYLRETYGLQAEWAWNSASALPEDAPVGFCRITGAVAPLKRNGRRNWPKRDWSTQRTFFVEQALFDSWKAERERTTGVCQACSGNGRVFASSGVGGTTYRPCRHCAGSGASPSHKEEVCEHG